MADSSRSDMPESNAPASSERPTDAQADRAANPTPTQIRRWRRYLAEEQAEAEIYRRLGESSSGSHREILLKVSEAENRHSQYWEAMLGEHAAKTVRPSVSSRLLMFLAAHFGSVFVLALLQRAESRSPYQEDADASPAMAADEAIHEEIVRALANDGRQRLSGNFRAAVFGANDGLVSNLALVMGAGATGMSSTMVLFTGIAGLLAGALSMGAGEFVSVRSQRELLDASSPTQITLAVAPDLDLNANELELIYRARGMSAEAAAHRVKERLGYLDCDCDPSLSFQDPDPEDHEAARGQNVALGTDLGAAGSSFCFFASGAVIPILPYVFGMGGMWAMVVAMALVGVALLVTGGLVGLLSGASPLARGMRQLGIGYGAAIATYLLGLLFNVAVL